MSIIDNKHVKVSNKMVKRCFSVLLNGGEHDIMGKFSCTPRQPDTERRLLKESSLFRNNNIESFTLWGLVETVRSGP